MVYVAAFLTLISFIVFTSSSKKSDLNKISYGCEQRSLDRYGFYKFILIGLIPVILASLIEIYPKMLDIAIPTLVMVFLSLLNLMGKK